MDDHQPRPQYYQYAHRLLPTLFFQQPEKFLMEINRDGMAFLRFFWDRVGEQLQGITPSPSTGLNVETRHLDDETVIVIIELPKPSRVTEAYFVAPVYRPPNPDDGVYLRYFTLEYGVNFPIPGAPDPPPSRTVLCEWTLDGSHVNYGDTNTGATAKAFLDAILDKLVNDTGFVARFDPPSDTISD